MTQRAVQKVPQTSAVQPRRYKRADIPTSVVLACVAVYGFRAYEVLCETFPYKVVQAAYLRDVGYGYLSYGTSLHRPWLDSAGEAFIRRERYKTVC